jgi:hypothetical protein
MQGQILELFFAAVMALPTHCWHGSTQLEGEPELTERQ